MNIKKLKVRNFKSFKEIDIELGKFNVIIGPNASGKSNFVQIVRFLRDIILHSGLANAVSMQGGIEYLRNVKIGSSENFLLEFVSDAKLRYPLRTKSQSIKVNEWTYELELKFKGKQKGGAGYGINRDELLLKCELLRQKELKEKSKDNEKKNDNEKITEGEIKFYRQDNVIKMELNFPPEIPIDKKDFSFPFLQGIKLPQDRLLLNQFIFLFGIISPMDIYIYDIDPKLTKKAIPLTGKIVLEEDGSNLPIVLMNIIKDKEMRKKLFNYTGELLPFISKLDVENLPDKSLLFKMQESYHESMIPASLISDGTINIIALIIALYFTKEREWTAAEPLIIIEEPERNIHPSLISKLIAMMKDASRSSQIIVTTHNPEVVKYAGVENLLLITRDKDGFSTISRPADKESVKTFLQNNIGIEELYVDNLL